MIRPAVAVLLTTLALVAAAPAGAAWTAGGTGVAFGTVDTLAGGNQPTATLSGHTVTVTWTQTLFHGLALGGYVNGGYSVRRYAAGGLTATPACGGTVSGATATIACSDSAVPPGSWQYAVVPLLGSWTGAQSLRSTVVAVAPDAPSLTSVAAQNPPAGQTTGAIALSWSAVAGADGYDVYRRTASGTYDRSAPLNGATPVTGTSFTDPAAGLTGGTTYAYVVRAVTAGAQSADSNELSAAAIARLAPPASVTAAAAPAGRIALTWPAVAGASGYNVYRRLAAGAYDHSAPLNGATPVTAASFNDATAVNGTTYRYVVRTVVTGAGGVALESLTDSAESNAATSDSVAPSSVTLADPGSPLRGTITLAATAIDVGSGVASVQMQYAPAGTSAWAPACTDTTSPYACSFNTASIADGLYDVRALATDVAGNTSTSTVVSGRRVDNTGPSIALADPGAYVRGTIALSATAADGGSGIASVAIQRAAAGTGTWTTICTDATSSYSCSLDTTTVADGAYDLRAIATDVAGNSTTSAIVANRLVDNTAPVGIDVQTTNAGIAAKPEAGDAIVFTFSEPMSPGSILAGWNGATTTVTVRFTNGNPDVITVWDAANTTQLALGSVRSGKKYVTANVIFSGSAAVMSAGTIVVTLGTPSGSTATANGNTTLQWTTSSAATDLAGNPLAAATILETGAADLDF